MKLKLVVIKDKLLVNNFRRSNRKKTCIAPIALKTNLKKNWLTICANVYNDIVSNHDPVSNKDNH